MKIVINECFGGFGLSHKAVVRYAELAGIPLYAFRDKRSADGLPCFGSFVQVDIKDEPGDDIFGFHYSTLPLKKDGSYEEDSYFYPREISRDDPNLVKVVEDMGNLANGMCSELKIVEIPDGVDWQIDEYDGLESIHEKHRSWG